MKHQNSRDCAIPFLHTSLITVAVVVLYTMIEVKAISTAAVVKGIAFQGGSLGPNPFLA